jgi:hypothetical protein
LTELKKNIKNLDLKLFDEKAINKPLANKMKKLVLQGRQQTLQDAYNNLHQIEHNFKTGKQGNEKRPSKN